MILDSSARIKPTVDEYVITNVDFQPNQDQDESIEHLNVLQDGSNIATMSVTSEKLTKEKRQIVNRE